MPTRAISPNAVLTALVLALAMPLATAADMTPSTPASNTLARACRTEAIRTTANTFSSANPFSRTTFSCESTHLSQALMAETARQKSSKSTWAIPCVRKTFMRRRAGMVEYFSLVVRW